MKRSEINKALKELEAVCEKYHCYLPPFCHFTPEEWQHKGHRGGRGTLSAAVHRVPRGEVR